MNGISFCCWWTCPNSKELKNNSITKKVKLPRKKKEKEHNSKKKFHSFQKYTWGTRRRTLDSSWLISWHCKFDFSNSQILSRRRASSKVLKLIHGCCQIKSKGNYSTKNDILTKILAPIFLIMVEYRLHCNWVFLSLSCGLHGSSGGSGSIGLDLERN